MLEYITRFILESSNASPHDTALVKDISLELTTVLGHEELILYGVEEVQTVLDLNIKGKEANLDFCICSINRVTAGLFEFLPCIRSMRHEHVLYSEATLNKLEVLSQVTSTETREHNPLDITILNTEEIIEANAESLEQVEKRLEEEETVAGKSGRRVPLYSALFQKERERLEEWRLTSQEEQDRVKSSAEVAKVQGELRSTFGICL